MSAPRETRPPERSGVPTEDEIRAARRAVALHRRRRYPDIAMCGLCGHPWETGHTGSGKPVQGCRRRRGALAVLDDAGHLDSDGRPVRVATP